MSAMSGDAKKLLEQPQTRRSHSSCLAEPMMPSRWSRSRHNSIHWESSIHLQRQLSEPRLDLLAREANALQRDVSPQKAVDTDSDCPTPPVVQMTSEARVTARHFAWRYVEGVASGLVEHLEGKGRTETAPRSEKLTPITVATLAILVAASVVDVHRWTALPPWAEGPAAALRVTALLVAARFGGGWVVAIVRQHAATSPYAVLLEGIQSYVEVFAAGMLCFILRLHRVSDALWADRLERAAGSLMAASALTACRWLVECLYSTRLLKLRCGAQVLENAWQRAAIDRLCRWKPSKEPPLALRSGSGIWEFDMQCAKLIKGHSAEFIAQQDKDAELLEAARIFSEIIAAMSQQASGSPSRMTRVPTPAGGEEVQGQSPREGRRSCVRLLELGDLKRCLEKGDADRAWAWLWGAGDEGAGAWLWQDSGQGLGIDEDMFVRRIMEMRADTRELVSSICEYNTIFRLFHNVVMCVYVASMALLALAVICPGALAALWWTFSSALVAVSFIFGPLIRDAFESLALILFIRPYDVGDRVVIADQRMMVVEINVLTTTFNNGFNELVWFRNSQIFSDKRGVRNLSRSEHAECAVELDILAEDSTMANIRGLERTVRKWCEERPHVWVAAHCGDATACAPGSGGILCSMAACGAGVMRWRFRAVHQRNLHSPLQVKVDASKLMLALIEACLARGVRLRRPPQGISLEGPADAINSPEHLSTMAWGHSPRSPSSHGLKSRHADNVRPSVASC